MKKLISTLSATLLAITPTITFITGCAMEKEKIANVNFEYLRFSEGDDYEAIKYKFRYALQVTSRYTKELNYALSVRYKNGSEEHLHEKYIAKMHDSICFKFEQEYIIHNNCVEIIPYKSKIPGESSDPRDNLATREFYVIAGQKVYDIVESIISFKYDVPRKDWALYIETIKNEDTKEKKWTKVTDQDQEAKKDDKFRVEANEDSIYIRSGNDFKVTS